ncbi:bifunctional ligase/repressor BirA [Haloferula sargassicola]|uniref:Bifunctional ligase/repressor BirA n=2 Tax=Haloferula sargassicola TaxID=490096 RepID=A0ABP9ULI7_9BACT
MWWLGDDPERLRRVFDLDPPSPAAEPPPIPVVAAWQALELGEIPAFLARTGSADDPRVLIHLGHAGRSPYESIRRALAAGARLPSQLVVVSGSGEGLRGHRDRSWAAISGNLHMSVLLRRPLPISQVGAGLSMLPSVVVADWLSGRLPVRPEIKWVNDLVVDGRKIGGVLASSAIRGSRFEDCLFGIGLNLAVAPEIEPDVFVPGTTCVAEWIEPPAVGIVARELLDGLDRAFERLEHDGCEPIHERYRQHCHGIGRPVRVWADEPGDPLRRPPLAAGTLEDVLPDLHLRVSGTAEAIGRGRLAFETDIRQHMTRRRS